jgi:predicted transcriptional regulator
MSEETSLNVVELAAELTIAWLGNQNNRVSAEDVPAFLRSMHRTISDIATDAPTAEEPIEEPATQDVTPAVTVRKSLASKDHIISMIDGKPYKALRRHLSANGLTPEDYRQRFNLKPDYPMVAENYSLQRREMAHKIGLGQKGRQARAQGADAEGATPTPAKAARKKRAVSRQADTDA